MNPQDDALSQRGKALEETFFRNLDAQLLAKLRDSENTDAMRKQLVAETGLSDAKLIDELVGHGITSEGLVALRLIPLALVAWADREVTEAERKTVLEEATKQGIRPGSLPFATLEAWLSKRPDVELTDAWRRYTRELLPAMSAEAKAAYAKELRSELTAVAKASGGILGLGGISDAESALIESLMSVVEHN